MTAWDRRRRASRRTPTISTIPPDPTRPDVVEPVSAEPARLDALDGYGLLDSPAEPGVDDLVHLAGLIC